MTDFLVTYLVCISNNAVTENKYVQRELRFVLDHVPENTLHLPFLIPLRLDSCQIPRHVQPWQYYDFSDPTSRMQGFQRLLKSLELKASLDPSVITRKRVAHFVPGANVPDGTRSSPDVLKEFGFVEIPRGKFLMGSRVSNPLAHEDEIPQHPCHIPYDYGISRFPITNEQFAEYAVSTKQTDLLVKEWRTKFHQPVVNITWRDAIAYANWLNKVLGGELEKGLEFRLPTEAEWERAARGDFGREWPWGNESLDHLIERELLHAAALPVDNDDDFSGSNEVSDFFARVFGFDRNQVYEVNGAVKVDTPPRWKFRPRVNYNELKNKLAAMRKSKDLPDVGTFSPFTDSPYKVGEMMGEIREWTQSLYAPYPYDAQDGRESLSGDGKRVLRGFFSTANERYSVRSARRYCDLPNRKDLLTGFRIVIAPSIAS